MPSPLSNDGEKKKKKEERKKKYLRKLVEIAVGSDMSLRVKGRLSTIVQYMKRVEDHIRDFLAKGRGVYIYMW